jgi:hypothetical protein
VYCPRCGHQNEESNRHCSNCGERLPELETGEKPAAGERWRAFGRRLLGGTRRERLITGGIAAALIVALVAFVALPADEDDSDSSSSSASSGLIPEDEDDRDPYIRDLDEICLNSKQELQVAAEKGANAKQEGVNGIRVYAREFGPITDRMLERIDALGQPPQPYRPQVEKLVALLVRIGAAGRLAAGYPPSQGEQTLRQFGTVQRLGGHVETLIAKLNLANCQTIRVTQAG